MQLSANKYPFLPLEFESKNQWKKRLDKKKIIRFSKNQRFNLKISRKKQLFLFFVTHYWHNMKREKILRFNISMVRTSKKACRILG